MMTKLYHKINSIFKRDLKGAFTHEYSCPEFEMLTNAKWVWDEKIDGTNIRVIWDGSTVTFGGRTDRAQIPANLVNFLQQAFTAQDFIKAGMNPMVLYGEGFGEKIQKGGGNYGTVSFVLFDVYCGDMFLLRKNVVDIGGKLEVQVVPIVGSGTLEEAITKTKEGFNSQWGDFQAEGLILRTEPMLFNRRGHRIITKVKCKDFK